MAWKTAGQVVLRYGIGLAALSWLIFGGKIDLRAFAYARFHPTIVGSILLLSYTQIAVASVRWFLLLENQGIRIEPLKVFSLTMVGAFFNVAVPGAVGGDVVKAFTIMQHTKDGTAGVLTSIVVDRLVGLWALLLIGGAAAASNFGWIWGNPLLTGMFAMVGVSLIAGLVVAFPISLVQRLLRRTGSSQKFPFRILGPFAAALIRCQNGLATLAAGVLLSLVCHGSAFLGFYLALKAVGAPWTGWARFLFLTPLGFLATAVPLTPSGIGVGQAAFFFLYHTYAGTGSAEATAFTVYQCALLLVYLSGSLFYFGNCPGRDKSRCQPVQSK